MFFIDRSPKNLAPSDSTAWEMGILLRVLIWGVTLTLPCQAVEPYTPKIADPLLEPWRFRHEDALSSYGVLCMDEAADGTLYFGGTEGLVRYDGLQVERIPYGPELLEKIDTRKSKPWTKAVLVLENGGVLAVVEDSLVVWSNGRWEVVLSDAGPSVSICQLKRAPDGAIWFLIPGGLWRISPDLEEVARVVSTPKSKPLSAFCFDEAGDVWLMKKRAGRNGNLNHIPLMEGRPTADSMWRDYLVPFPMPSRFSALAQGRDSLIWFADRSIESGPRAFDTVSSQWVKPDRGMKRIPIYSMTTARDGTIWAGFEGAICRIDPEGQQIVYSRNQLQLPNVPFKLYETSDQRLWAIGQVGYVYSIDVSEQDWMTYEGLNFQCETKDGVQWFTEKSGAVVTYDPQSGAWLKFGTEEGVINSPGGVIASRQGLVWAAGSHEGAAAFSVYDGERWTRFLHPEFAELIEPNSAFEAKDGTIWFGAGGKYPSGSEYSGGALRYEVLAQGGVQLKARYPRPLFTYYSLVFAETEEAFWMGGTTVQGYDEPIRNRVISFEEPKNSTAGMVVDREGSLWVAKEHLGVFRRQGGLWRQYTNADGFDSRQVADLRLLRDGSLLAASAVGISRFDGNAWTLLSYLKHFGMTRRRSGVRETADGSLWFSFAGNESLPANESQSQSREIFRVTRHRPEKVPPETRISEYMERVSQPGNCYVKWSALDPWGCSSMENIQYSWRLDVGPWSEFSFDTGYTFLSLDHGNHVLEVRARDEAFNVDQTPARVAFSVVAPLWMQPWFVLMVASLVGMILALVWIIFKNREKHLRAWQSEQERVLIRQQADREKHLLEMDQLKTGFFTNISHELRTPLTVILGPLQKLLSEESDKEKRRVLGMMERNANRVAVLISQLLDFRKLEKGKVRMEAVEGDLSSFLEEVVDSLKPLAESNRVSCRLKALPACRCWFDPDKFEKIATNLFSNAIKYTAAEGDVRIELAIEQDEGSLRWAVLAIEDNGSGIDAEHRSHIFERFYRIPEQKIVDGSGIGLNLTYELVKILGGTIDVESPVHDDPERPGSRFTVRLPIDREGLPQDVLIVAQEAELKRSEIPVALAGSSPASLGETECRSAAGKESPMVLIVEDDQDIRSLICEGLESLYRIETAVDGIQGLEKARQLLPDLVVSDVMMPGKDGFELCRELKCDLETSHIPVVLLTAKTSLSSQIEGLETGADDYVVKPFNMDLLRLRVCNLLESRRILRELYGRQLSESMNTDPKVSDDESGLDASIDASSAIDQAFLDKVRGILKERVCDPEFNVEQLSDCLHLGARNVRRKVKALTGRSPLSLIMELRLKKAAVLLRDSSLTVTEIAFEVGFSDSGNFSKQFRREFGMTPSVYRSEQSTVKSLAPR